MGMKVKKRLGGISERRLRAVAKAGLLACVEVWHQTMMPKHFTTSAVALYDYAPRTAPYMRRKARRMRHQKPLVFSGQSRDQAKTATFRGGSIASAVSASAVMSMPSYFVQHPNKGSMFIDKPDELTRTTEQERQQLAQVFTNTVRAELGMNSAAAVA